MKELFKNDAARTENFHIQWNSFLVDYSKNRINDTTLKLLLELAEECQLKDAISSYFNGQIINRTENRAVLHTALRAPKDAKVLIDGINVIPEIYEVKIMDGTNQLA